LTSVNFKAQHNSNPPSQSLQRRQRIIEDLLRRTQELRAFSNSLETENKMNKAVRIVLVDGYELFRHGLRYMLESEEDMQVVGDYASAEEAVARILHREK